MGGEFWPQSNGTAKTYGDITDAFKAKQENVSSIYRSTLQPEQTSLPLWLKLVLIGAIVVLFVDKYYILKAIAAKYINL